MSTLRERFHIEGEKERQREGLQSKHFYWYNLILACFVTQTVNNLPTDTELDPWFRKIPWRREWQRTPVFLPGEFRGEETGRLQSTGSQSVGHDWMTNSLQPILGSDSPSLWSAICGTQDKVKTLVQKAGKNSIKGFFFSPFFLLVPFFSCHGDFLFALSFWIEKDKLLKLLAWILL